VELQPDWRWCSLCEGLVFTGISHGVCFLNGVHTVSQSGEYSVPHGTPPPGAQEGWRWCKLCQGARCRVALTPALAKGHCVVPL
jgi:hypothetical protein